MSVTTYTQGIKDGPYWHGFASGVLQATGVMRSGFPWREKL
ncbi:hypothetical protein OG906_18330 [Streptomyces sp. NBC_01426]|nr:hypothetical protein [Streptomyces sp. NBC_01426]